MKYFLLIPLLVLCGCGTYAGSEGVIYNPDEFLDFQTPDTKKKYEEQIGKAYEAGKKGEAKPELNPVVSNKVEIVGKEQVKGIACLLGPATPFGPLIPGGLALLASFFITKRKKKGL